MRSVRVPSAALLLALSVLAPAASLRAAPVDSLPDTTGILTPWRLEPAAPCVTDSVSIIVRGFVATPCDSFLGAEAVGPMFVRIRRQVHVDRICLAPPTTFYPVPVALGRLAAGPQLATVVLETIEVREDGTSTRHAQQYAFLFFVAAECPIPPPQPGPLPFVQFIGSEPVPPCAGRPTTLVMKGVFNDGCGRVLEAVVHDPQHVELTLAPKALPGPACPLVITPWRQDFDLGTLPAGAHQTDITLHVVGVDSAGNIFRRETFHDRHDFFVRSDCDSIPPPVPGTLPYVEHIAVGREAPCGPFPACPGDSIPVRVYGAFPHDCLRFRRIELIPSMLEIFPPPPPSVRIIVDDGGCLGRPCVNVRVPWSAAINLPPWTPGDHRLDVQLAQVTCSDSFPPGELFRTSVPFAVADSCVPPPPCMTAGFFADSGGYDDCDATVALGRPAELTFRVRSNVALAGLQGELRVQPTGLRITRMEPVGPAEGMLLEWSATPNGVRFVLVSLIRATIPPIPNDSLTVGSGGWPVLRVVLEHAGPGEVPARTTVTPENLLGSDKLGQAVPLCPPPPCASTDMRLAPGRAVICAERECDFNSDGLQDVRDLVLMVRCATGEISCPQDAATRFDCDGDSAFAIPDVICCARHVLRRPSCADCPPDTGLVRPAPGVGVTFETPEVTATGLRLPVVITGEGDVGAALLTLEAPLDRYDVVGFDVTPPGDWLALHEVRDGRIVLGLIDVRDRRRLDLHLGSRFTLALALRPGQPAGGQVTVVAGEFSGPDGVSLGVDLGRPSQALPGAAQIALGPNQPNPFSTETAFTLALLAAADVVVGIYDLRGRTVAILHRAPLGPGPHVYRWDGRGVDGGAAPNGIYFYRATVGGRSLARKLILMRGR